MESILKSRFTSYSNDHVSCDVSFSFHSDLPNHIDIYPPSNGRIFYVSQFGNDNNDGLSELTPITINKVSFLTLLPGDSVLFKNGEVMTGTISLFNLQGDDNNPITFANYGNDTNYPTLTNGTDYSKGVIVLTKPTNVVIKNLNIIVNGRKRKETSSVISGIKIYYPYVGDGKYRNIYIIDNIVQGNGSDTNVFGIDIDSLEDQESNSPSNVLSNCIVNGNEVANVGRSGIRSSGWLVNQVDNHNECKRDKYTNFYFDGNLVHDIGCMGIYILGCKNSTIMRNKVYNTGMCMEGEGMEGECGIMALCDENCDISFNEVHSCHDQLTGYDSMGIDIDWNTINIKVEYNYCHDNQGSGVGTMANQGSYILKNKLVNNQCATNNPGSITITNFTARCSTVPESMYSVQNLLIRNNLVIHNDITKYAFVVLHTNGNYDFINDIYQGNHVVCYEENSKYLYWNAVQDVLPWYKFDENSYYSKDLSNFVCYDKTQEKDINSEEGARAYSPSSYIFSEWKERDQHSTFEMIDDSIPSKPNNVTVEYTGVIGLKWRSDMKNVWHFNIYELNQKEKPSYLNMIGETENTRFSFTPKTSGQKFFYIEAESNVGRVGEGVYVNVYI